jgi:hypothetical protein
VLDDGAAALRCSVFPPAFATMLQLTACDADSHAASPELQLRFLLSCLDVICTVHVCACLPQN